MWAIRHIILFILLGFSSSVLAQYDNPVHFAIDSRRADIDYVGEAALKASREFLKMDSNYYVGWMYLGTYMHDKASDFIGFKNAIDPLQKAMRLIERDRNKQITSRSIDIVEFLKNLPYQRDYDYIAYCLYQCYCNTEQQAPAWTTIARYKKKNLFTENYMDSYNTMSWHVHRNRFYTHKDYDFLKNSIAENLRFSHTLLDSQVYKIQRDNDKNSLFVNRTTTLMNGVYHYRSLLYSYDLNMDSGQYYYDKLKNTTQFPANNYATFCSIGGKFREAEQFYTMASFQEGSSEKRLHEYAYYNSIINVYKGSTKDAIQNAKTAITLNGSTPGFGWYNLALGRSLLYDGDVVGANYYIDKAMNFKEIHIGTTLGETHYNFTSSLLKFIAKENEIRAIKFNNKRWYFSITAWSKLIPLYFEKYTIQNLLVNQLAANPERDNVVYKLFSSESTVSFDEIWYLVQDFSTDFFIKKFKTELAENKRPLIRKYFKLFLAKLYIKEGEYTEAGKIINDIIAHEPLDAEYEKLFSVRLYEATAQVELEMGNDANAENSINAIYALYPQILPYTDFQLKMALRSTPVNDEEKAIISNLKKADIDFVSDKESPFIVSVSFSKDKETKIINYEVKDTKDREIVSQHSFSYTDTKEAARILQLAIFNIGINYKNLNQEVKPAS